MKTPMYISLAVLMILVGFYFGAKYTLNNKPQPQPMTVVIDEQKDYIVTSVTKKGSVEHVAIQDSCGALHYELNFTEQFMIDRSSGSFSAAKIDLKKGDKLNIRDSYLHKNEEDKTLSWIAVMTPYGFGTVMLNSKDNQHPLDYAVPEDNPPTPNVSRLGFSFYH